MVTYRVTIRTHDQLRVCGGHVVDKTGLSKEQAKALLGEYGGFYGFDFAVECARIDRLETPGSKGLIATDWDGTYHKRLEVVNA